MRFFLLDGLRGVAAFWVVVFHASLMAVDHGLVRHGTLAVDFFFALSGFVIAHAYEAKLRAGLGVTAFMRVRLIRLYPMIVCGVVIGALVLALRIVVQHLSELAIPGLKSIALNVLLLPSPFLTLGHDSAWPINGPHWSLTFELLANLAYGIGMYRLRGMWFAVLLLASGLLLAWCSWVNGVDMGWRVHDLPLGGVRVCYPFFVGVGLYRLYRSRAVIQAPKPFRAAFIALLLTAAFWAPIGGDMAGPYEVAFVLVLVPLIVWFAAAIHVSGFAARLCEFVGDLSFPLYAVHYPILKIAAFSIRRFNPDDGGIFAIYAVFVVVSIVVAQLLLIYVDKPARRRLGKIFSKPNDALAG